MYECMYVCMHTCVSDLLLIGAVAIGQTTLISTHQHIGSPVLSSWQHYHCRVGWAGARISTYVYHTWGFTCFFHKTSCLLFYELNQSVWKIWSCRILRLPVRPMTLHDRWFPSLSRAAFSPVFVLKHRCGSGVLIVCHLTSSSGTGGAGWKASETQKGLILTGQMPNQFLPNAQVFNCDECPADLFSQSQVTPTRAMPCLGLARAHGCRVIPEVAGGSPPKDQKWIIKYRRSSFHIVKYHQISSAGGNILTQKSSTLMWPQKLPAPAPQGTRRDPVGRLLSHKVYVRRQGMMAHRYAAIFHK